MKNMGTFFFSFKGFELICAKKEKTEAFYRYGENVSLSSTSLQPLKKGRIPELEKTEREKEREKENGVGRGLG